MAFTAQEVSNIANAMLDYYLFKGKEFQQSIQNKPLLALMEGSGKDFPGGKGNISLAVKGTYGAGGVNDSVVGYTHNDTVNFYTPANIQRINFPWKEMHIGLTLTHTELKIDGISVTDDMGNGNTMSNHSDREETILVDLLEDKLQDLGEQYARTMNALMWGDGTLDAKAIAGIRSIIVDSPTLGTTGGLSRVTNAWWRNRAATAANLAAGGQGPIQSSAAGGGALLTFLQGEFRQLVRFGSKPNKCLAGSSFIGAMENEIRGNGYYSQTGFTKPADGSVGEMTFKGLKIEYDPTLDDLGYPKRAYIWDTREIYLMKMQGEWKHAFTPARPSNQFVMYKSLTMTGQMVTQKMNGAAVYDVA